MGDSPNLLMPVNPAYTASWISHTHRSPKSTEPGTDMFVPIGTPVYAPADGRIYGYGNSIIPATGRWVGIDLDNGLRFRAMHFSRLERTGGRVARGDLIGYSGASGYGHEDWSHLPGMPGAHVHVTLWPTQVTRFGYKSDGRTPWTVDFMQYVGGEQAAGESKPKEWDEMATEDQIGKIVEQRVAAAVATALAAAVDAAARVAAVKIVLVESKIPGRPDVYLTGPGGQVHVSKPEHVTLLRRYIKSKPWMSDKEPNEVLFTPGQFAIITDYLARLAPLPPVK